VRIRMSAIVERGERLDGVAVLAVSHGFQTAYERGFCSALAYNGARVILAGSDRTDRSGMHPQVRIVNIRGSQEASRTKLSKAFNMVRYHMALLVLAWRERDTCLHVIGLLETPMLTGILEGVFFRMVCRSYLLTIHNLLPHDSHTFWNRVLYRLIYRLPTKLIVHTIPMREKLVKDFGVNRARVVVMEHGCELGKQIIVRKSAKSGEMTRLLFLGMIAPYKGVDILLDAFERIPTNFELRIVGLCRSPTLRSAIEGAIAKFVATGRHVSWRNEFVAEREMASALDWTDIIVMPYRYIDQSGVLFHALKFGVPMVATRVGDFGSFITRDIGELCEPENADSLATAIVRLSSRLDSISRERIAVQARHYDWRSTVQTLGSSYAGAT